MSKERLLLLQSYSCFPRKGKRFKALINCLCSLHTFNKREIPAGQICEVFSQKMTGVRTDRLQKYNSKSIFWNICIDDEK
jgi:hypothetical protein